MHESLRISKRITYCRSGESMDIHEWLGSGMINSGMALEGSRGLIATEYWMSSFEDVESDKTNVNRNRLMPATKTDRHG